MARYEAKFYDSDAGQLFFYLRKASSDKTGVPFEFDGPAEPKHIKDYVNEHDLYLESKARDQEVIQASIPIGK